MSKNKRAPKVLQRYVVFVSEKTKGALKETFHYVKTQAEAKEWARGRAGVKQLFKIDYDFYGEIK